MAEFPEEPIYAQLARIGKAIANSVRLRLLDLLDDRERTVEEIAEESGIAVKNTSAQLQQLRAANLVAARKEGKRVYYRLADDSVPGFLDTVQRFAEARLADLRGAVAEQLGDPEEMRPVDTAELAARLDDPGVLVLDVRSEREYAAGHIPGALSMPFDRLRERLGTLSPDLEIVAYCGGPYCVVSPNAARLLRERGYHARPLDGGFTRWRRATGEQVH
ncbi:ArsR/SmtB family transcription factor [Sciscionella marina]|uniref:ArsR/SmtB family transcription factor n=1 Tax=Sciscionella marina TaxID=508770 RepID=UPI000361ED06|nr:metalloregulator ArsR/SmtB family transcription factor [Sciscionella marina]